MPVAEKVALKPSRRAAFARVVTGMRWGIAAASPYIAWALILFAGSGGAAFEEKHASFLSVVAAYLCGGIAGGAVVGLLLPLMRYRLGAAFVGMIAFIPVLLGFRVVEVGFVPWRSDDTEMVITLSTLLGGFAGLVVKGVIDDPD